MTNNDITTATETELDAMMEGDDDAAAVAAFNELGRRRTQEDRDAYRASLRVR